MEKYVWTILKIVLIIALIIAIVCLQKNEKTDYSDFDETFPDNTYYSDYTYNLDEKYEKLAIDEFLNLLNTGNYEQAYQKLTQSCKDESFPTVEAFRNYVRENLFLPGAINDNVNVLAQSIKNYSDGDIPVAVYVVNIRDNSIGIYEEHDSYGIKLDLYIINPFQIEFKI